MSPARPSFDDILALPGTAVSRVPPEHIDGNGHLSVRFHVDLATRGAHAILQACGLTDTRRAETGLSVFAAEHHLQYLHEVGPQAEISVRTRMLGRSGRAVRMLAFLLDHSSGRIATALQTTNVSVSLVTRRSEPFPAPIATRIDQLHADHLLLDWQWPVCPPWRPADT